MKLIFHEALRTVQRYNYTTMEYIDQIYMVQNYHGRVIIKYRCKTGLKKKQKKTTKKRSVSPARKERKANRNLINTCMKQESCVHLDGIKNKNNHNEKNK